MDQLLCQLNQAQLEAVTSTEGFIRVIAGAGSGKNRALSHRFAFLVNEIGILPGNLPVSYTHLNVVIHVHLLPLFIFIFLLLYIL